MKTTREPVEDLRTLKMLERAGHITLHPHTGKVVRTLNGSAIKAWYIEDNKYSVFEHKGVKYVVEYFSGSFFPYVMKITNC